MYTILHSAHPFYNNQALYYTEKKPNRGDDFSSLSKDEFYFLGNSSDFCCALSFAGDFRTHEPQAALKSPSHPEDSGGSVCYFLEQIRNFRRTMTS